MAAIDEVKAWLEDFKKDGSIRTDFPPPSDEECYNPIEHAPRRQIEELRDKHLRHIVWRYSRYHPDLPIGI